MNVYAVIVTYNAMKWIDRCLASLQASSVHITTIVVDNGSQDDTLAHIQTHFPEMILLPQKQNLGFGQGNNVGIRYALDHQATHVLLLNQDAWIDANMIEKLLVHDDGNSLLSPIHLTGEGDKTDRNFEHNAIMRSPEYRQYLQDIEQRVEAKYPTWEINAACWLLPRKVLQEIGGFNPLFFHYAEDTDYLQRLHYHQKGVYFVSGTYCYHDRANVVPKNPTKQSFYQNIVLRAVNINYSRCMCFLLRLRYGIAVWHTALAEHRMSDIRSYYQAQRLYCKNHREIKRNRELLNMKAPHWIE